MISTIQGNFPRSVEVVQSAEGEVMRSTEARENAPGQQRLRRKTLQVNRGHRNCLRSAEVGNKA